MDSILDFIKSTKGFLTTALELCNTLESDMKSDKLDLEIKEEKLAQAKDNFLKVESLLSDLKKIPIKLKSTQDNISTITEIIPNKLDTDISTYIKSIIFNIVDKIVDSYNIVEIIDDTTEEETSDVEKKSSVDKSNIFTILAKEENTSDKTVKTDLRVVLSDISDIKINSDSNPTTLSEGQVTAEDNLMILNYAAKEAILNDSESESVIIESQSVHESTVSLIKECSVVLYDIGQNIPTNKSEFQDLLKLDKEINRLCCIPTNKSIKKPQKKNGTVKRNSNLDCKKKLSNIYQSDSDASSEFSDTKSHISEFKVKINHMSEPPLSSTDSDSSLSSVKDDTIISNGKKHTKSEPQANKSKSRLNLTIPKSDSDEETGSNSSSKITTKSAVKRKQESSLSGASDGESDASISDLFKKVSSKKKPRSKKLRSSKSERSEKTPKKVSSCKKSAKELKEEAEEVETRKNIHKIITNSKLSKATKTAAQLETERRKRIEERQKEYNQEVLDDDVLETSSNITLVLEKDADGKPLVQVAQSIVNNLKPHQIDAVKFLWDCVIESVDCLKKSQDPDSEEDKKSSAVGGCVLAHCMGLGKTLSLIAFMHTMLTTESLDMRTCLVICPVNTALNWKREWEMWMPDKLINVFEVCSTENKKLKVQIVQEWHAKGGVLIIGYQMYRLLANGDNRTIRRKAVKQKLSEALVNPGPDFVVCDEGHLLKNDKSAINKIITKINTRRRIVLTGTPLQNKLLEYHTMVQFVKPNLLGTHKEFLNRFVNPIHNGQHSNSTPYDVSIMKKRSHILFKMLDGCVHRRDYSSLVKYLPPKFEYVIKIRMSDIQVQLYRHYISMCRENKHSLFQDHLTFSRIWTHPYVICMHQEIMDKKLFFVDTDDDDEDNFINDGSDNESKEFEEKKPSSNSNDVINLVSDSSDADNSASTPMMAGGSSRKRLKRLEPVSSGSDSSADEVVRSWSTSRRSSAAKRNELAELGDETPSLNGLGPDKELGSATNLDKHWWSNMITPEIEHQIEVSGKLSVLFQILRKSSDIGDKIIIFSQSLIVLDIIEKYLEELDTIAEKVQLDLEALNESIEKPADTEMTEENAEKSKKPSTPLLGDIGYNSWKRGLDYDRMDGSTHALMRADIQTRFNSTEDHRLRLFLISTRAGGMGINLVSANRVVIFDVSWNPSHDIQAIFRSYRFGQTKPVYVYRFVSQGTMEEKIYERQVTKQSLSLRVVDEQQISRYFTEEDLRSLYKFEPDIYDPEQVRETPIRPKDRFLAELIQEMPHLIHGYHEHNSLLQNKSEEELTEEERKEAWNEFEEEKLRGSRPFLVPGGSQLAPKPMPTDANRLQQFQISMMLQQYPQYATLYAQNYNNLVNYVLSRNKDLNPIQLNNEVQQVFLQSLQKYYNIQLHARNNQTNPDPIASTSQPM